MKLRKTKNAMPDSFMTPPRIKPSAKTGPPKKATSNVLAQQQMMQDMQNGTFETDFKTDLVAPDMPNPFAEVLK